MDRAIRVLAAINEVAGAEGVPVAVHHVCVACAAAVKASGVGLYLISDLGLCEPLYVTNPVSEQIAELQVTFGEGPGTEALREDHPHGLGAAGQRPHRGVPVVACPRLRAAAACRRWPVT